MKKTRTVIVAMIMFFIVLLLIIIVAAVATSNSSTKKTTTEETTEIAENNTKQTEDENAEEGNLPPVSNSDEPATIQSNSENEEPESEGVKIVEINVKEDDLPQTGPESILPLAILLGTATTYVASCICVREKRVL